MGTVPPVRAKKGGATLLGAAPLTFSRVAARRLLNGLDVFCLWTLLTLLNIKLHALPFFERSIALGDDRRLVDEHVTPIVRLDETEPLRVVKPLYCTSSHETEPCCAEKQTRAKQTLFR